MATTAGISTRDRIISDHKFYRRWAIGIALFIILAFIQFSARGYVDIPAVPIWVHVHALVFVGWLALFVAQNLLAERGALALHRRLGWAGAVLATAMVGLGMFTGIRAIEMGRQPPFFTPPFFLALTQFGMLVFAGIVVAALALRRRTDWHRRLMLCATVLLLEPAFGRVLPMPLTGQELGEAMIMVIQLAVIGFAALHDRKLHGALHPALLWGAATIVVGHAGVSLLARTPAVIALADSLAPA